MSSTEKPIGNFRAKAISGALGFTQSGKEQVAVLVELLEGPMPGYRTTWYGYFGEHSADRTLESLMIAGWDGDDITELKGLGKTEFSAAMEEDEYDGKKRVRCSWINRLFGDTPMLNKQMAQGEAAAFAQKMKGRSLAVKQKMAAAPPTAPQASSPPSNASTHKDDEIPY